METLNQLMQLEEFISKLNKRYNIKIQISKYNDTEKKNQYTIIKKFRKIL